MSAASGREMMRLPNVGPTIARRLAGAGIASPDALRQAGPVAAYVAMQRRARARLPLCYYLYALDGALRGVDWRSLGEARKSRLRQQAAELLESQP